jgi:hypothetical protein
MLNTFGAPNIPQRASPSLAAWDPMRSLFVALTAAFRKTVPTWFALFLLHCDATGPADVTVPVVDGVITSVDGYAVFVPGDTLRVTLGASDDNQLAYLGYILSGPTDVFDTARVAEQTATRNIEIPIHPEWVGVVELSVFAVDAQGNSASAIVDTIDVIDAVRRSMVSVLLPGLVYDVAWDSVRGRLYLSLPSRNEIAVLDLRTQTLRTPIEVPGSPWGLDLTLGSDSLVVALRDTPHLAMVNLEGGAVDLVHLGIPPNDFNLGPANVRVLANGKALVSITFDGFGFGGEVREFDFATGASQIRMDAGLGSKHIALTRSNDRQRLLLQDVDTCCTWPAVIYGAATDSFDVRRDALKRTTSATLSADARGTRFLIDDSVFDALLNFIVTLEPVGYEYGASVITPNGIDAYMATYRAYVKVRIPHSVPLERVLVPLTPERLWLSPDGRTLVATTPDPPTSTSTLWLIPES